MKTIKILVGICLIIGGWLGLGYGFTTSTGGLNNVVFMAGFICSFGGIGLIIVACQKPTLFQQRINRYQSNNELEPHILDKIANTPGLGGMTVNERLYVTNLSDDFYRALIHNKARAREILKRLGVDEPSIQLILHHHQGEIIITNTLLKK